MPLSEAQKISQKKWRENNKEYMKQKNKEGFKRWYEKNRDKHNKRSLLLYHAKKQHPEADNVILCSGEQGDEGWAMACYDCNQQINQDIGGNIVIGEPLPRKVLNVSILQDGSIEETPSTPNGDGL